LVGFKAFCMLHLVNYSTSGSESFRRCLSRVAQGDSLLLIENGVCLAIKGAETAPELEQALTNISVFALGLDLEARGFTSQQLLVGVEIISYSGFVRLAADNSPIQSWFI